VVYHEFAHALAFEHHLTFDLEDASDTAPRVRAAVRDPETWRAVLSESLDKLCDALERGEPTALDSYGANNQAEFFAVATETFFERPRDVRAAFPHLYDQFCGFYRQDPAQWVPRPEPTGPRDATQPKSP
jgi:Mlc titration factor MtfA (ptsG expression regulator)